MKKLLSIIALFTTLLINCEAYSQTYDVVYLRIVENYIAIGRIQSYMQLTYSNRENETFELNTLGARGDGAPKNGNIIVEKIKKLLEAGYILKSQSSAGTNIFITSMVFIKTEEENQE